MLVASTLKPPPVTGGDRMGATPATLRCRRPWLVGHDVVRVRRHFNRHQRGCSGSILNSEGQTANADSAKHELSGRVRDRVWPCAAFDRQADPGARRTVSI